MVAETKQNEAWATHAVEGIDLLNAAHRARVGVERDRLNPHGFLKRHFFVEFVGVHAYKVTVRGRRFDQSITRHPMRNPEPKNARFGQPYGWETLKTTYFQEKRLNHVHENLKTLKNLVD